MKRWLRRERRSGDAVIPPLQPLATPPGQAASQTPAWSHGTADADDQLRPTERWNKILAIAEALASDRLAGEVLAAGLEYPLAAYDQFRRNVSVRPPPPTGAPTRLFTILIDAQEAAPFMLRATLRSLQDQSITTWSAHVAVSEDMCQAPVGSFADTDTRVSFAGTEADVRSSDDWLLLIDAGTVLDPEALAWFAFALERTGADAAFADHDHGLSDPVFRLLRADPVLFGTYDEELIAEGPSPAVVVVRGSSRKAALVCRRGRKELLVEAGRSGRIVHVPRLLATRLSLPLIARRGQAEQREKSAFPRAAEPPSSGAPASPAGNGDRIGIVIPTRDCAGFLARAIDTLRATARRPERLDIVVVDNRSVQSETRVLFDRLIATGAARVVPLDAPFNWSLASNLGAAASNAPLIAFVNNDVEMLSPGWDEVLADVLSRPHVGAVGARLLYPDRTLQHAGIAFGFGPSGTEHEGRGVPAVVPGPGRRYVVSHAVSAVTGAFLALRRRDFEQLGGFDAERLMIAYSDVDLCLRLRETGKVIQYCPAIEAIHHEGATRGINATQRAIAWDEGERLDLIARWGEALADDPGISPYWRRGDQPFETIREPTIREILAHIDRSASLHPWRPSSNQQGLIAVHPA